MTPEALRIAGAVRRWSERYARQRPTLFPDDLCGMCAIASALLFTRLRKAGFKPELWSNYDHCFVVLGSEVLDVTATQFFEDQSKIFVTPVDGAGEHWDRLWRHVNVKSLRKHQVKTDWRPEQIVQLHSIAQR